MNNIRSVTKDACHCRFLVVSLSLPLSLLLPSSVAADPAMELSSLLVRAVGKADLAVEDARLRVEEVAAPSPSTPL